MSFAYKRDAVPFGQIINLDVQFTDSAGFSKDTDATPTVEILDANSAVVNAASSIQVQRIGLGLYRLEYEIPGGFAEGFWTDEWNGAIDGYSISATFSFFVNSIGEIKAVDTTVHPDMQIGDDPGISWTQAEIQGINVLLQGLQTRLRNQALTPDGTPCPVVPIAQLVDYLRTSLSEFNSFPTITGFGFDDAVIYGLFADVIIEGAFLQALSAVAILSAGQELTVSDNGVILTPPPVSATINTVISSRQALYLEKLKSIKRAGLRPMPRGMGAGRILVNNPSVQRLRHRREGQIL